jgi:hypothetical protein
MALGGGLLLAASLGVKALQFGVPPMAPSTGDRPVGLTRPGPPDDEPYVNRDLQERQMKRLREEHQKQVFSDTDRLLKLATDLNAEVDKAKKPTLDAIKDVDEIGRLAKRVSERIKTQ